MKKLWIVVLFLLLCGSSTVHAKKKKPTPSSLVVETMFWFQRVLPTGKRKPVPVVLKNRLLLLPTSRLPVRKPQRPTSRPSSSKQP